MFWIGAQISFALFVGGEQRCTTRQIQDDVAVRQGVALRLAKLKPAATAQGNLL